MSRGDVVLRPARRDEVAAIVALLADDPLAARRERPETPLPAAYLQAFDAIECDQGEELVVAVAGEEVVGVLQLSVLPSLTRVGGWRAQVEGVRVAATRRGDGIGRLLLEWAIERARARGCVLLQLSTDRDRPDALRFYQSLGFVASHHGLKLSL